MAAQNPAKPAEWHARVGLEAVAGALLLAAIFVYWHGALQRDSDGLTGEIRGLEAQSSSVSDYEANAQNVQTHFDSVLQQLQDADPDRVPEHPE